MPHWSGYNRLDVPSSRLRSGPGQAERRRAEITANQDVETTRITQERALDQVRLERERLLDAADELFYQEGIQSVGIDRVIERAGVAKASLYNAFGSKDELVRAYLEGRQTSVTQRIMRAVNRYGTPRERLLAVFEGQGELFAQPGYRGLYVAHLDGEPITAQRAGVSLLATAFGVERRAVQQHLDLGASTRRRNRSPAR